MVSRHWVDDTQIIRDRRFGDSDHSVLKLPVTDELCIVDPFSHLLTSIVHCLKCESTIIVGTFNQGKAPIGAFYVIVKLQTLRRYVSSSTGLCIQKEADITRYKMLSWAGQQGAAGAGAATDDAALLTFKPALARSPPPPGRAAHCPVLLFNHHGHDHDKTALLTFTVNNQWRAPADQPPAYCCR